MNYYDFTLTQAKNMCQWLFHEYVEHWKVCPVCLCGDPCLEADTFIRVIARWEMHHLKMQEQERMWEVGA